MGKQFEYHEIITFEKNNTPHPIQYKLDVLNYMNENGTSPNEEAAFIFNISSSVLIIKWRNQLGTQGIDATKSKKKRRPSTTKKMKNQ